MSRSAWSKRWSGLRTDILGQLSFRRVFDDRSTLFPHLTEPFLQSYECVERSSLRKFLGRARGDYDGNHQGILTLGIGGDMTNLGDLSMMLSDDNPVVQVAAAGAILRISGEIYGIQK